MRRLIPHDILIACTTYDPQTGDFRFRHYPPFGPRWNKNQPGKPVPRSVYLPKLGRFSRAQMVFARQTKTWPAQVRFVDGNPDNLKLENLFTPSHAPVQTEAPELTPTLLSAMYSYNPTTGEIRERPHPIHGRRARHAFTRKYTTVLGQSFTALAAAFTLYHGRFPYPYEKLTPLDGDHLNKRLNNIAVTIKGIYQHSNGQDWFVSLKGQYLGIYPTYDEALEKLRVHYTPPD